MNSSTSSDLVSHISATPSEKTEGETIHVEISSAASSDREDDDDHDDTMAQRKEIDHHLRRNNSGEKKRKRREGEKGRTGGDKPNWAKEKEREMTS